MLFISIPTPCHEKWNEMSPNEQGAFCSVCSKTVVDFTSLSDEEVQNYFLSKRGQKTCGRFRNDQLTDADDPLRRLLAGSIPFWKKFLAIVLVVFGSLLSGCQDSTTGKARIKAKEVQQKDYTTSGITITDFQYETKDTLTDQCTLEIRNSVGMTEIVLVKMDEDVVGAVDPPVDIMGEMVLKIKLDENGNEIKEQQQ
ncbi:MAG: hypothetical protein WDO16_07680 [Bacteroidota bacterium]